MRKLLLTLLFVIMVIATFCGYKGVALAADPCGGTGGNGQIVSIGDNAFTMKRNDDDQNQVVHLASQVTINTSSGTGSLADLKIGERTTLVGGPNRDGSFTADAVFVCNSTQAKATGQETQPVQTRIANSSKVKTWSLYINTAVLLLVNLIWVWLVAYFRLIKKKSLVYLLYFTIFYVYLIKVLDYTLFQFQSLIILRHFVTGLMLNGQTAGKSLNLIPLFTLKPEDVRTSLLNILMMIPFGFGLPFITDLRFKKIVIMGGILSIIIEFLQLTTGLIGKITFRVADINDVIFNTLGVAVGYILFIGFIRIFSQVSRSWKIKELPILRYITERPQIN